MQALYLQWYMSGSAFAESDTGQHSEPLFGYHT